MTITEIQKKISEQSIKGFLADDEARALYDWASEVTTLGPCLEIGSYCGKSSIFLGHGCKRNYSVLFAVDHHRGSEEHQQGEEYHDADLYNSQLEVMDSFPQFRRNMQAFDLDEHVIPIVASSALTARAWATPLAMVFIDGGHSEAAAKNDCMIWSQFVLPKGILAIHDIFPNPEEGGQGPYLAMQAVLASGDFVHLTTVRSLAILQRI